MLSPCPKLPSKSPRSPHEVPTHRNMLLVNGAQGIASAWQSYATWRFTHDTDTKSNTSTTPLIFLAILCSQLPAPRFFFLKAVSTLPVVATPASAVTTENAWARAGYNHHFSTRGQKQQHPINKRNGDRKEESNERERARKIDENKRFDCHPLHCTAPHCIARWGGTKLTLPACLSLYVSQSKATQHNTTNHECATLVVPPAEVERNTRLKHTAARKPTPSTTPSRSSHKKKLRGMGG